METPLQLPGTGAMPVGYHIHRMIRTALRVAAHVLAVLVCVLSAVVCAVSIYQWGRGYRLVDVWEIDDRLHRSGNFTHTVYRVSSGRGVVSFNYTRNHSAYELLTPVLRTARGRPVLTPTPAQRDSHYRRSVRSTLRPDQFNLQRRTVWQKLGFNVDYADEKAGRRSLDGRAATESRRAQLRLPYWAIVPVTAAVPVLYLRRLRWLRRAYRTRQGLCPGCGYDLRASTGRCPECGETIKPARDAAAFPPCPGTPGEGRGEGFPGFGLRILDCGLKTEDPHPRALPEYREREESALGSASSDGA